MNTLLLASLTSLANHIAAHPNLDHIGVYHVCPAFEASTASRIEVRLYSDAPNGLTHLAIWAATLTSPTATAELIRGSHGSPGHVSGQVDGKLADGSPVRIIASVPLDTVAAGRHPLTLPTLAPMASA